MRSIPTTRGVRRLLASLVTAAAIILGASACGGPAPGSNDAIDQANGLHGCGQIGDAPCDRMDQLLGRTGPGKWDGGISTNLTSEDGKDAVARVTQDTYSCDATFSLKDGAAAAVFTGIIDADEYVTSRKVLPKGPGIPASDLPDEWQKPNLSKPMFLQLVKAGLAETNSAGKPTKLATALGKICQKS